MPMSQKSAWVIRPFQLQDRRSLQRRHMQVWWIKPKKTTLYFGHYRKLYVCERGKRGGQTDFLQSVLPTFKQLVGKLLSVNSFELCTEYPWAVDSHMLIRQENGVEGERKALTFMESCFFTSSNRSRPPAKSKEKNVPRESLWKNYFLWS